MADPEDNTGSPVAAPPGTVTVTTTPDAGAIPTEGGAAVAMAAVAGAASAVSEAATEAVEELQQDVEAAQNAVEEYRAWQTTTTERLESQGTTLAAQGETLARLLPMVETMSEAITSLASTLLPKSSSADAGVQKVPESEAQTSPPNPEAEASEQAPGEKPQDRKGRRWM